jgi:hypothetical protein
MRAHASGVIWDLRCSSALNPWAGGRGFLRWRLRGTVSDALIERYAHYSTVELERLLRDVETQHGGKLPTLAADIRGELERRRLTP